MVAEDQDVSQALPCQIDGAAAVVTAAAAAAATSAVGGSFSFNLIFSIVMKTSLNTMLSAIKNLQIIVHLCLLSVIVPGNSQEFFNSLFDMIAFDPIDIREYADIGFDFSDEDSELTGDEYASFVGLGYESA